ncbi:MAG: DUF1343 domain-containing protein [Actinomycetota bacterium]
MRLVGSAIVAFALAALVGCSGEDDRAAEELDAGAVATTAPQTIAPTTSTTVPTTTTTAPPAVTTGARSLVDEGFASLAGQRVGLVANPTSFVGDDHLIDLLDAAPDVELAAIFAPEHGLRGVGGAGELLDDEIDRRTGVTVFSLYGDTFRPTPEMLEGIDVLLYDLQDVGSRFYTYIATMGFAMEAAAEAGIEFVVLDRPVVSGGELTGGFVLVDEQRSFVGPYELPAAYGLTSGELATMLIGEGWLDADPELRVVELSGWRRGMRWDETGLRWVPPSPGLPTVESALVYPGTVFLEATTVSFGGGTDFPFSMAGAAWIDGPALATELSDRGLPGVSFEAVEFTPRPIPGRTRSPRFEGEDLAGVRIVIEDEGSFRPVETGIHLLEALVRQGEAVDEVVIDRPEWVDLLAGTTRLRELLEAGAPAAEIVAAWADEVAAFDELRRPYLRYG